MLMFATAALAHPGGHKPCDKTNPDYPNCTNNGPS
jgi:hypothetical protein